ncbi:MAG: exosortase/archaeosortase family protein [Phycisphaerae bacterium]
MTTTSPGAFLTPAAWARIAILAAMLALVYWDVLRGTLAGRWINDPNWSHGWLIPVFSLYFLYSNREALRRVEPRTNWLGGLILLAALGLFFFAVNVRMAYPQAFSIVVAIFGITLLLGGVSLIRHTWFPICFLFLAVPLPQRLYVEITLPLRELATKVATVTLPILVPGLYAESQAVVIEYVLPGAAATKGRLNVEEACSGMRLLMAFVTLGVAMAYLRPRPTWQRVILVLSCLPISVICNGIRVTVTGWLHVKDMSEWARGTPHELLGLAMLGLALALYALIAFILENLLVDATEDHQEASSANVSGSEHAGGKA